MLLYIWEQRYCPLLVSPKLGVPTLTWVQCGRTQLCCSLWQTKLWLKEYSDTLDCQFRTFLNPAVKFASDSFLGREGCSIKSHFLGVKSLQPTPLKAAFCVSLNVWTSRTTRRKREGSLFVLQNRKVVAFYTVNMH